jgi:hypothetical protein
MTVLPKGSNPHIGFACNSIASRHEAIELSLRNTGESAILRLTLHFPIFTLAERPRFHFSSGEPFSLRRPALPGCAGRRRPAIIGHERSSSAFERRQEKACSGDDGTLADRPRINAPAAPASSLP